MMVLESQIVRYKCVIRILDHAFYTVTKFKRCWEIESCVPTLEEPFPIGERRIYSFVQLK